MKFLNKKKNFNFCPNCGEKIIVNNENNENIEKKESDFSQLYIEEKVVLGLFIGSILLLYFK
jgi:hypothetical protein